MLNALGAARIKSEQKPPEPLVSAEDNIDPKDTDAEQMSVQISSNNSVVPVLGDSAVNAAISLPSETIESSDLKQATQRRK